MVFLQLKLCICETFGENLCGALFKPCTNSAKLVYFDEIILHVWKSESPILYLALI